MVNIHRKDVRNFLPSWTIEYGFIKYGDKSRCGLCSEIIVSRTSSIKRHFETNHKEISELNITERKEVISQRLKVIENQSNLLCKFVKTSNNVTEASFEISHLIAKHSKPFCEGEFLKTVMLKAAPSLFQDFNNKDKILQRIQELQLSRNTIKERILKMTVNISDQLQSDINSCDFFSICLDETTDIKSSARLAIFSRFSNGNEMREELLKLANIPERTRGTDLFEKHVGHPIIGFHCIIHQQMLCSKVGTSDLKELSEQVNKIINFIVARDMHKRQFKKILNDVNCEYDTLLLCNNVRWLSRATSLERFVNCLDEIRLFLHDNKTEFKELYNTEWLVKLMFFTDLTLHLNTLNKKLQGRGKTIKVMFGLIKGFEMKIDMFINDVKSGKFLYFPKVKKMLGEVDIFEQSNWDFTNEFSNIVGLIKIQFSQRFHDFKKIEKLIKIINYPDLFDVQDFNEYYLNWMELENLEMQLIDLQTNPIWTNKFVNMRKRIEELERHRIHNEETDCGVDNIILEVWNNIPENFSSVKKLAISLLTIFSSTYACESLFSVLNHTHSKARNRLTEEDSAACITLQSTSYQPDIKNLSTNMKQKISNKQ
ncbi:zinc finger BED domain-containing protein 5-like [Melanaphis sacchari]|uniref:zinc finger BED domain-containing protein 5-like n=1 Tax=Melanaphis sacchari TaxID=742174 RepID=UPI000DC13372|nr:zinc finger BED domain-containing protein 5-like [Melanaphis sacchari]